MEEERVDGGQHGDDEQNGHGDGTHTVKYELTRNGAILPALICYPPNPFIKSGVPLQNLVTTQCFLNWLCPPL